MNMVFRNGRFVCSALSQLSGQKHEGRDVILEIGSSWHGLSYMSTLLAGPTVTSAGFVDIILCMADARLAWQFTSDN